MTEDTTKRERRDLKTVLRSAKRPSVPLKGGILSFLKREGS